MSEQDTVWLEKCKKEPNKYRIMVDKNSIWVEDIFSYYEPETVHNFSEYGQWFIIECLSQLGFNVSGV